MAEIVEALDAKSQNQILWQILQKLADELRPHLQQKPTVHSSEVDPWEFFTQKAHFYISAGKQSNKIIAVKLGFPDQEGFFGKKPGERRIYAYHNVSNELIPLVKKALDDYATACRASQVILGK